MARRSSLRTLSVFIAILCATALGFAAPAANAAQEGALTQLVDPGACVQEGSDGVTCSEGAGLEEVGALAESADGQNVYAAGGHGTYEQLTAFSRNADGSLQQLDDPTTAGTVEGCFSGYFTAQANCSFLRGAPDPSSIAIPQDGKHVYVGSYSYTGIAVLARDLDDGALTQLADTTGCLTDWNADGQTCEQHNELVNVADMKFSADGTKLYVAGYSNHRVVVYDRDTTTGALTFLQSLAGRAMNYPSRLAFSPEGNNLYVGTDHEHSIVNLQVAADGTLSQPAEEAGCISESGGQRCTDGRAFSNVRALEVSPDGDDVYSVTDNGLVVLERDATDGSLRQPSGRRGCWTYFDAGSSCKRAQGMYGQTGMDLSPDGTTLYVTSRDDNAVVSFERVNGRLRLLAGREACDSLNGAFPAYGSEAVGTCDQAHHLDISYGAKNILVSADGASVYVAAWQSKAISVFARQQARNPQLPERMSWDLAEDFRYAPGQANPSPDRYGNAGVWSYRSFDSDDGIANERDPANYQLLPHHSQDGTSSVWLNNSTHYPHLYVMNESWVGFHPNQWNSSNDTGVFGWTNPLSQTVQVNVAGMLNARHRPHTNGINWYLDHDGAELRSGQQFKGGSADSFDFDVPDVEPGDTLWLILDNNGDYNYDTTDIDLRITGPIDGNVQTTIGAGAPRGLTKDDTPTFSLTSNVGNAATFQCRAYAADANPKPDFANCTSPHTTAALANGANVFEARAKDPVSNLYDPTPARREFTVDATPPVISILAGPNGSTRDASAQFSFTSTESGTRFYCKLDDADYARCDSPRSFNNLAEGAHTFSVKGNDTAGNEGNVATRSFTIDTSPDGLQPGALSQLTGTAGCLTDNPGSYNDSCTDVNATGGAMQIATYGSDVYVTGFNSYSLTAFTRGAQGALTQRPGDAGCFYRYSAAGCTDDVRGLSAAMGVAVAPDGENVYVTGYYDNAVVVFKRNADGSLEPMPAGKDCVAHDGNLGCVDTPPMANPVRVVVSPDNANVYVVTEGSNTLVAFDRAEDGSLTPKTGEGACFNNNGSAGCGNGRAMGNPRDIAIAPDGKNVYLTSRTEHTVLTFERLAGGALRQIPGERGCFSEDNREGCYDAHAMGWATSLVVSPDNRHVFIGTDDSIVTADRDPDTGALSFDTGRDGCTTWQNWGCNIARYHDEGIGLAITPDGRNLYALNPHEETLALFRIDGDGHLRQLTGADACIGEDNGENGSCRDGRALRTEYWNAITVSQDGANVYVPGRDYGTVAVFRRGLPTSASDPQPYEWDAAADFRLTDAPAGEASTSPDAYGNGGVWRYQSAPANGAGTDRHSVTYADLPTFGTSRNEMTHGWFEGTDGYLGAGLEDYSRRFRMHPEDAAEGLDSAVTRWRNPLPGTSHFKVQALVQDTYGGGDGVNWYVDNGTEELASGTLVPNGRAQSIELALDLAKDEDLFFVVSPRGNDSADGTFFDIHITGPAQPAPQTQITGGPTGLTKDGTPAWTFTSNPASGASFECRVDDAADWTACASGDDVPLADGRHTFRVRAKTASGADPSPAVRTVDVDTVAPTVTFTADSAVGTVKIPRPQFKWNKSEVGDSECQVDDGDWQVCSSPYSPPELANGTHTIRVRGYDHARNVTSPAAERTVKVVTGAASLQPGALAQLGGDGGCIARTTTLGSDTCAQARNTDRPISGDFDDSGKYLYVANRDSRTITAFERTTTVAGNGSLTQLAGDKGCVRSSPIEGECVDSRGMDYVWDLDVHGDTLYAISYDSHELAVFKRGADGSLTQPAGEGWCVEADSASEGCTAVPAFHYPRAVSVAPDGKHVYVAVWGNDQIRTFARAEDGSLTPVAGQAGCVDEQGEHGCEDVRALSGPIDLQVSPDNQFVYALSYYSRAVHAFTRNTTTGDLDRLPGDLACVESDANEGCANVRGIGYPRNLVVSADGNDVYVASEEVWWTVTHLSREADGSLSQTSARNECADYSGGVGCVDSVALRGPSSLVLAPDGRNVYVTSHDSNSITSWSRSADDGTLRQLSGLDACVSETGDAPHEYAGRCRDGKGLNDGPEGNGLAISPDGKHVYVFSEDSDAIAGFERHVPRAADQTEDLVWDAQADFRTTAAPAGEEGTSPDRFGNAEVWRYKTGPDNDGTGSTRDPAAYVPLTVSANSGNSWYESAGNPPYIHFHTDAGRLDQHPGPQPAKHPTVLEWKNPLTSSTEVNIAAQLDDYNNCGDGVTAYLDRNTTQLATRTFTSGAASFEVTETVEPGDSVYLSIWPRGAWDCDGLYLDMTITADGAGPGPQTVITSGPRTTTADATPSFAFTGGASYACRVDGGDWAACASGDALSSLEDGSHTFEVRAVDGADTDPTPANRRFTVDTTAPALTVTGGPDGLTRDRTPTYTLSRSPADAGSRYDCRIDSSAAGDWTRCNSPFTTPELVDGAHTIDFRAVDRWGNASADQRIDITVDRQAGGLQFGGLTQLVDTKGCTSNSGSGGACVDGRGLDGAAAVRVSPDGKFVYATSVENDTLLTFARAADGSLTQLDGAAGCLRRNSTADDCGSVRALDAPHSLELSPDGSRVYVASTDASAVLTFSRDATTGVLTQLDGEDGCVRRHSTSETCRSARATHRPFHVAVSPDGDTVYAINRDDWSVSVFDVGANGGLTQLDGAKGCLRHQDTSDTCTSVRHMTYPSDIAFAGENAYISSPNSNAIGVYSVDGADGSLTQLSGTDGCVRWVSAGADGCGTARAIGNVWDLVASPDGSQIYAADEYEDGVSVFDRSADGTLSMSAGIDGCWSRSAPNCRPARAVQDVNHLAMAPDGKTLYAASMTNNSVAVFRRTKESGTTKGDLEQLSGQDGCWSESSLGGVCRDGKAMNVSYGDALTVSPDGASVYLAARDSDALAAFARRIPRSDDLPPVPEWNVARDFDTSDGATNPSADRLGNAAVWSYLKGNSSHDGTGRDPAAYQLFTTKSFDGSRSRWHKTAGDANDYPLVQLHSDGAFVMHPRGDANVVARWENPGTEDSGAEIHAVISDVDASCGDGVRWFLDKNGVRIAGGYLNNGGAAQAVDRAVALVPADMLEIVVTRGNSNDSCDSTRVEWQITGTPVLDTGFTPTSANGLISDSTPAFEATSSETDATIECRSYPLPAPDPLPPFTTCAKAFELGPLADGEYRVEARSVVGGNTDQTPAARTIKIDATKPAPVVTGPAYTRFTSSLPLTITGTASDTADSATSSADAAEVTIRLYQGSDDPVRTFSTNRSGTNWSAQLATAEVLPAGRYTAKAFQEDVAGNLGESAAFEFKIDNTAPVVATTAPPASVNCQAQAPAYPVPLIEGTAGKNTGDEGDAFSPDEGNVTIRIYSGSAAAGTPVREYAGAVSGAGTFSQLAPGAALAEGLYSVQVEQKDLAGNSGKSTSRCFKIDRTAPIVSITKPTVPAGMSAFETRDRTPAFAGQAGSSTGSDPNQSPDELSVDIRIYAGTDTSEAGTIVQTVSTTRETLGAWPVGAIDVSGTEDLLDGTYTAVAEQKDKAGNTGRSAGVRFEVDRTGPAVSISTPPADTNLVRPTVGGTGGTLDGTAANSVADDPTLTGKVVRISTNEELASLSTELDPTGAFGAVPSADLVPGRYRATAHQEDVLGNATDATHEFKVDLTDPTPELSELGEGQEINDTTPRFLGSADTQDGTVETESADSENVTLTLSKAGSPDIVVAGTRTGSDVDIAVPADKALAPGVWSAVLSQSDNAGNVGESAPVVFEVDVTDPALTVGTDPNADVKSATPVIGGTAGQNADNGDDGVAADLAAIDVTVEGLSNDQTRSLDTTRQADGTWSVDWTGKTPLPAGSYAVTVAQTDDAENTKEIERQFKVDLTDPAPTVAVPAEKRGTSDTTPTLSGAAGDQDGTADTQSADGGQVTLTVKRSGMADYVRTFDRTSGTWSHTIDAELAEGLYTATIAQSDASGRTGTSSVRKFKVDLTDPAPAVTAFDPFDTKVVPVLAGTAEADSGQGEDAVSKSDTTVDVAVFRVSTGQKVDEMLDVPVVGGAWTVAAGAVDLPADGRYDVRVTQADEAGNDATSEARFRYDTQPPVVNLTAPENDGNDPKPHLVGTAGTNGGGADSDSSADVQELRVTVTGAAGKVIDDQPVALSGGAFDVAIPTDADGLEDGTYSVVFKQSDAAGNSTVSLPKTFRVDTVAPVVGQELPADDAHHQAGHPHFKGDAGLEEGAHPARSPDNPVTVRIWSGATAGAVDDAVRSFTLPKAAPGYDGDMPAGEAALPEGQYAWRVYQTDNAGNSASSASTARTFRVDRTVPVLSLSGPTTAADGTVGDDTPAVTGTAGRALGDLATVTVTIRKGTGTAGDVVDTKTSTDEAFSVTTASLADGTYTAVVTQSDRADNVTTATRTFRVDDTAPAPAVAATGPTNGTRPTLAGTAGSAVLDASHAADDAEVEIELTKAGQTPIAFTATRDGASWMQATDEDVAEGRWTATATQGDGAVPENRATSAGREIVVDRTAPVPFSVTPSDGAELNTTTPHVTAKLRTSDGLGETASDNPRATVIVYAGTGTGGTVVAGPTVGDIGADDGIDVALDLPGKGTYTVAVSQQDAAGNIGTATSTFKVDTTAPAVTIDALADDHVQTGRPVFSGDAGTIAAAADETADLAAVKLVAVKDGVTRELVASRDGARWTAQPAVDAPLAEGLWTVHAEQTDGAGNTGSSVTRTIRVDQTAPNPTLTSPADGHRTADTTPAVSGARSQDAGDKAADPLTVTFVRGVTTVTGTVTADGTSWTAVPASELAEGTWTVQAHQTDGAGLTGDSAGRQLTIDTTKPTLTVDAIASPRNSVPSVAGDAGTATGDAATVTLSLTKAGAPATPPVANVSGGRWSASLGDLADGTYTLTATQTDDVGNSLTAERTFVLDTVKPAPTVTGPSGDLRDSTPALSGTAGAVAAPSADAATVAVKITKVGGATLTRNATRNASGTWTLTLAAVDALADGRYTALVEQSDAAGNTGVSEPTAFRVDTQGPAVELTAPTGDIRDGTPTFTGAGGDADGTGEASADSTVIEIRATRTSTGAVKLISGSRGADGTFSLSPATALADGTYTAVARQKDAAGNLTSSAPISFRIDSAAPVVDIDVPAADEHLQDATPELSGNVGQVADGDAATADLAEVKVRVYDNDQRSGTPVVLTDDATDGAWAAAPADALPEGYYWAEAEQRDAAGNVGKSALRRFRIDLNAPAPAVTAPADGAYTNDTTPAVSVQRGTDDGDLAPLTVRVVKGDVTRTISIPAGSTSGAVAAADALTEGDWTVTVSQGDKSGRTGTSAARTLRVDLTDPLVGMDAVTTPRKSAPTLAGDAGTAAGDAGSVTVKVTAAGQTARTFTPTVVAGRWTVNLPALADGTYTATVTQADEAANSAVATRTFTLDNQAPAPTVAALPNSGDLKTARPTLTGSAGSAGAPAADGSEVKVTIAKLNSGVTITRTATRTGGTWTLPIAAEDALGDGRYTATAEQTDLAGNTGTSAARAFRVDTAAPQPTLTAPDGDGNDSTPTFAGLAGGADGTGVPSADASQVKVEVFSGSVIAAGAAPVRTLTATRSGNDYSVTPGTALANGTYTAIARQSDAAGNAGSSAARTFKVDTVKPVLALTTPAEGLRTKDTTPAFAGSAGTVAAGGSTSADAGQVKVSIFDNAAETGTPKTFTVNRSGGAWSGDAPVLAEGTYYARAEQRDGAGNVSLSPQRTFHVDTTAPAPTVVIPADGDYTNDTTPAVKISRGTAAGDLAPVTVTLVKGAVTRTVVIPAGSTTGTVAAADALTEGDWTVKAAQSDSAGNDGTSAARTLHVDLTKPVVAITKPADKSETATNKPELAGTAGTAAGDAETVTVTLTAANQTDRVLTPQVAADGTWTVTPETALPDAAWKMTVTQVDAATNQAMVERTFTVDVVLPQVSISEPAEGGVTNDATPKLAGKASTAPGDKAAVKVEITAGGAAVQTLDAARADDGGWSVDAASLADGTYTAEAAQADNAGNVGTSPRVTFRVDTTAPGVAVSGPSGSITDVQPTITGTAGDGLGDAATVNVRILSGSTPVASLAVTRSGSSWSAKPTAPLAPGAYTIEAAQADSAGNVGTATGTFTVTVDAPPIVDTDAPQASGLKFTGGTKVLSKLLSGKGAPFQFDMSETGTFLAEMLTRGKSAKGKTATAAAKKLVVLSKVKRTVTRAGKQKVTFKLSKKTRRALRKTRKLKVTIRVTMTDAAGNKKVVSKKMTLKK